MAKKKSLFEVAGLVKNEVPVMREGGEVTESPVDKEYARINGEDKKEEKKGKKEEKKEDKKEMLDKGAIFIGKMFRLRDTTHLLHLKSESYAEHKALNKFYDALLDSTDAIAEAMQCCGLLDIRIPASVVDHTALDYISAFRNDLRKFREECERNDIISLVDDLEVLCSSTIYKLKFLK